MYVDKWVDGDVQRAREDVWAREKTHESFVRFVIFYNQSFYRVFAVA